MSNPRTSADAAAPATPDTTQPADPVPSGQDGAAAPPPETTAPALALSVGESAEAAPPLEARDGREVTDRLANDQDAAVRRREKEQAAAARLAEKQLAAAARLAGKDARRAERALGAAPPVEADPNAPVDILSADREARRRERQRQKEEAAAARQRTKAKVNDAGVLVDADERLRQREQRERERLQRKEAGQAREQARLEQRAERERQRQVAAEREQEARELRVAAEARRLLERAELKASYDALERDYTELRKNYYLSGYRKKIDIREVQPFASIVAPIMSEGRLGMGHDRLYTLWQAVSAAPAGLPMIEIGAYKGGSAKVIAECLKHQHRTTPFWVCDTFQGHAVVDPELDPVHRDAEKFLDTSPEEVRAYLADYQSTKIVVGDIHDTADQFRSIPAWAFVHVDVDVHPATDFCLRFFAPKLALGAWLVVDDYGFVTCPGSKKAVDDFIAEHDDFRMLHMLTGQAIVYRIR